MARKHAQHNDRHMLTQRSSPNCEKWFKSHPTSHQTNRPHVNHETEFKLVDEDANNEDSETDGSLFGWEDEATLFSDLMEEGPPQTEDQQYDALVETLQGPYLDKSKRVKKEIAGTLVPAVNRVKAAYQALDQHIDTAYGQGILQFNKACTEIEETMSIEQTEFLQAYQATEEKIEILFDRLQKEYAYRDQLWVDVKKAVDDIVTPAIDQLKDIPASVERTIVKVDKKSEPRKAQR